MNDAYATITGHLGRNADSKQFGERYVISFAVAVSRKRKEIETTTWWNVNYWVKSDNFTQYLKKGCAVSVRGQPHMSVYKKKDGTEGQSLNLDADNVQLLGMEKQESAPVESKPADIRKPTDVAPTINNEEPPF